MVEILGDYGHHTESIKGELSHDNSWDNLDMKTHIKT
jgi:hypothetical protein